MVENSEQLNTCVVEDEAAWQGEIAGSEFARALGAAELLHTLGVPFSDAPPRFWEKAIAFWAIGLVGVAAATISTWLGWGAVGPILSCGIACGLMTGATVWSALPCLPAIARRRRAVLPPSLKLWRTNPRPRSVFQLILPATLAAVILCALIMGLAHQWLFLPSTAELLGVSAVCYFIVYCAASFLAPVGAFDSAARWPAAVHEMAANWHKAAGVGILTLAYLLATVPAAVVIASSPVFFEGWLLRLTEKPRWAWLLPMAEASRMVSAWALQIKLASSGGFRKAVLLAGRRCVIFAASLPVIIMGSWYAILTATARMLAQLGWVRLDGLEQE